MTTCTWAGCGNDAVTKERDRDGQIWARFCVQHGAELGDGISKLAESVGSEGIPGVLANWIKAQGGADKAAVRMAKPVAERLIEELGPVPDATGE